MRIRGSLDVISSFLNPVCRGLNLASILALAWGLALPVPSAAQQKITIKQTPRAVEEGTARLIGPYPAEQKLRLVFALKPPHLEEEEQFLRELQDRDSPLFHKYLSPEEWAERFAPSVQDEEAVVSWAQSQGLTITQRYPNRLLVDVEAPVANIQQALGVAINHYQVGEKTYFSNDRDPEVPAALASVVHAVLGLNSLEVRHSASERFKELSHPDYSPGPVYAVGPHLQRDADQKNIAATATYKKGIDPKYSGGMYFPYNLYSSDAYDYEALQNLGHCCNPLNYPNNSPPEASIAIDIWDDFSDDDLNLFIGYAGSSLAQNVQRYFVDGTPQCCGDETTLDVEWATAMANSFSSSTNTAKIHVYEGADGSWSTGLDEINSMLRDGHARVLSMSWGGAELYGVGTATMDSYHAVFNQMVGQGWSLVAASGDSGATAGCAGHLSVWFPASDPDVTAAGGTTLDIVPGYNSEVGWSGGPDGCSKNDGGSGGGCSTHFSAPNYQSSPACGANSRSLPDMALNADPHNTPQMFYYERFPWPTGGTSVVAPEIAGIYAQENAYLLYLQSIVGNTCGTSMSSPCAPMGNANYYLYDEALHQHAPHYPFYDITYGCNDNDVTHLYGLTPFCAGPGYDMVTGWGSANMLQLAWMINDYLAGDAAGPVVTFTGPPPNHWYKTDETIGWTVTDNSRNGHVAVGVAGYTAFWDFDPGDPYYEPTPGDSYLYHWNSFYSGPQVPNATSGSTDLWSAGNGCHVVNVRAWDNAGQVSANQMYGPLCLDDTPPYTWATLSGNQGLQGYIGPVLVTLAARDNDSGVASTFYQINGGAWQSYTGPFYVPIPGTYILTYYSTDVAGNVENTEYTYFTIASSWQYQVSVAKSGTGSGTITSIDGAINCGSACSAQYYDEQPVTLTATSDSGFVFTGWSGCDLTYGSSCTMTVTSDRQATAIFNTPVALQFIPITPCRLLDTRPQYGGSGPIQGGTSATFNLPELAQAMGCGDLSSAAAYSLNAAVVPSRALSYLTLWPAGLSRPYTATLNSLDGRIKANAAIVPAGSSGAVYAYMTDTSDLVLDIDGYFVPAPNPAALAFYPITPCRVADTRDPNQPSGLGPPYLHDHAQRDFPVLSSRCPIPGTAQAYSFNFAVVPHPSLGNPLGYMEVWPKNQRPANPVSTLNNLTGTIVANAAIVPAGTDGAITVYPSSDTDLVIDINGYFAPPGPNGLSLYAVAPCRVIDTRKIGDGQPFTGTLTPPIDVVDSACAPDAHAEAYVMNATAVPQGPLGYLTLWPDGEDRPLASTLNALDGAITNNLAVVPTNQGAINAYASGITQLVLDISSYFAP